MAMSRNPSGDVDGSERGSHLPGWRCRLRASIYDLAPICGWLGGVGAANVLLNRCHANPLPRLFANPATADIATFTLTVLPVGAVLSAAEAGPSSASFGKRRAGLRVVDLAGNPPDLGRAALRNAIKLAAWQVAHLGLLRVTGAIDHRHARTIGAVLLCGCYLLAAADVAPALLRGDGRALHDLAAGTRVVAASSLPAG